MIPLLPLTVCLGLASAGAALWARNLADSFAFSRPWLLRKPLSCNFCCCGHASWIAVLAAWLCGGFPPSPLAAAAAVFGSTCTGMLVLAALRRLED